ncbi:MAG: hypothetical protein H8E46_10315 [FCB group bacterium]|nr:hypothetical protein [FCB group bacterium]
MVTSAAMSYFFGWRLEKRLQIIIREKHYLELLAGNAETAAADHPKIPYVISAPTMRVPSYIENTVNAFQAVRAMLILV